MSKLSFKELKKKAKEIEIKELMESISGGTENACHDSFNPYEDVHRYYRTEGGFNVRRPRK